MDGTIARTTEGEEELETEICDADTYQSRLEKTIALLTEFNKKGQAIAIGTIPKPPTPSD